MNITAYGTEKDDGPIKGPGSKFLLLMVLANLVRPGAARFSDSPICS